MTNSMSFGKTAQCLVLASALFLSNCAYLFGDRKGNLHTNLPWCVIGFLFFFIPFVVDVVVGPCLPSGKGLVTVSEIPNHPDQLRQKKIARLV